MELTYSENAYNLKITHSKSLTLSLSLKQRISSDLTTQDSEIVFYPLPYPLFPNQLKGE